MVWQNIHGHDKVVEQFRRASQRGRLAGSFLFVGPSGIGKRSFAVALAKAILCKGTVAAPLPTEPLEPCNNCESCRLFNAAERPIDQDSDATATEYVSPHPDLLFVSKPPNKTELPLELLIGDKEHRGHSGLCFHISRSPYLGHQKVAVIDDADFLNVEGANALLKTLEEPPEDAVLILIGTSAAKQLPTIRSRCKIIRFSPLPTRTLATLLLEKEVVSTLEQGLQLARRADGSLDHAKDIYDESLDELRGELTKQLTAPRLDDVGFAQKINEFVKSVGEDSQPQRRRLRLLFSLAIELFRDTIRKCETPKSSDSATIEERHISAVRQTLRRLDRTLDAMSQVDSNANLQFVVDAWCNDLKTAGSML